MQDIINKAIGWGYQIAGFIVVLMTFFAPSNSRFDLIYVMLGGIFMGLGRMYMTISSR